MFGVICRICRNKNGEFFTLDSQIDDVQHHANLLELFNYCMQLEALLDDALPQLICQFCLQALKKFDDFLQTAKQSDAEFQRILADQRESQKLTCEPKSGWDQEESNIVFEAEILHNSDNSVAEEEFLTTDYLSFDEEQTQSPKRDNEEKSDEDEIISNFNCILCVERFQYQRQLLLHYEREHTKEALGHDCAYCEKSFVNACLVRLHTAQRHLRSEHVDCELCGRMLVKSRFSTHQQRHQNKDSKTKDNGLAPLLTQHACSLCDKVFVRSWNLKLHMQMHRGETIDCTHCGKHFVRRKDLEIHVRFHTGDFPYACSICEQRFAVKSHLKYHMQRHSGVRYKCLYCDKEFVNISGLRQHSFEHTGMPLTCDICQRGFPTRFKMRRHLRSVHGKLFVGGYTHDLADQHYTSHAVGRMRKQLTHDYTMVEVLEEHAKDINDAMLLL